jgi:hypothetical protein
MDLPKGKSGGSESAGVLLAVPVATLQITKTNFYKNSRFCKKYFVLSLHFGILPIRQCSGLELGI